jgi:hypothetical protein
LIHLGDSWRLAWANNEKENRKAKMKYMGPAFEFRSHYRN